MRICSNNQSNEQYIEASFQWKPGHLSLNAASYIEEREYNVVTLATRAHNFPAENVLFQVNLTFYKTCPCSGLHLDPFLTFNVSKIQDS